MSSSRFKSATKGEKYSDGSGDAAQRVIKRLGHDLKSRELVADDESMIRNEAEKFLKGEGDVVLFLGGTGVAKRDITIETLRRFFEKELDGFGEIARRISYDDVGAAAMLTRATAGVARGKLIVCLPGSPDAVRLILGKLGKEFPHAIYIARS